MGQQRHVGQNLFFFTLQVRYTCFKAILCHCDHLAHAASVPSLLLHPRAAQQTPQLVGSRGPKIRNEGWERTIPSSPNIIKSDSSLRLQFCYRDTDNYWDARGKECWLLATPVQVSSCREGCTTQAAQQKLARRQQRSDSPTFSRASHAKDADHLPFYLAGAAGSRAPLTLATERLHCCVPG